MMDVSLQPHTGTHLATRRTIDLGQDRIFVDGEDVGYVGRRPDAAINLIYPDLPEDTKAAIRQAVRAKYGGAAERMAEPLPIPEEDGDEDAGGDPDDLD